MNNTESYKSVDRFYLQQWAAKQFEAINFDLVEHMHSMLVRDARYSEIYAVDRKQLDHLKHNQESLRNLMRAPFLMFEPTLENVEDWRCLIEGAPTTVAVDNLRRSVPPAEGLAKHLIQQHNRSFLDLVTGVIHMCALSAPLLGMRHDLAKYLATVPVLDLRLALERIGALPLYRWRFDSPMFWYEFTAKTLTPEMVAHQIMLTAPEKSGSLPRASASGEPRMERSRNEMYAAAMMAHGCRASTVANLFRLPPNAMRNLYYEIHGESSKCGNLPTSLTWATESASNRVQASFFTWLYRSAVAEGANHAEALIATYDIYGRFFVQSPLISADRGNLMIRAMAADTRLTVSPCRSCSTHYVLANSENKIEMSHSWDCPACTGQLAMRRRSHARKEASHDA